MARTNKPYQRPEPFQKRNPDGPGSWTHDLHESASRSSHAKPNSLLSRISGGKGRELLPVNAGSKLYGFDGPAPSNPNKPNSGVELLPSGSSSGVRGRNGDRRRGPTRGIESGQAQRALQDATGFGRIQVVRPVIQEQQSVSIMGVSRQTVWVRVEGLAIGTTAEDVVHAFAPLPILNATVSSPAASPTVWVDLEFDSKSSADEVIQKYNGVVADGNTLKVAIYKPNLSSRISGSRPSPSSRELLPPPKSSKLYSDSILSQDPRAVVITLAQEEEQARARSAALSDRMTGRNGGWSRGGGQSLSNRMGRR
ncbi:hypothetical protein P7C73_g2174, partial [Tremellales sp. Uapishka_1]